MPFDLIVRHEYICYRCVELPLSLKFFTEEPCAKKILYLFSLVCLFIVVFAQPASADMGLPMIFVASEMVVALIPIIAVETYILVRLLLLPVRRMIKVASVMNIVSTLFGVPATWLVLVGIQIVTGGGAAYGIETPFQKFIAITWQAPWLIPYHAELYWMVPAAWLVLLIPFFFGSWFIEYVIVKKMLKEIKRTSLKRAILLANLASYGLLTVAALWFLVTAKPA